MNADESNREFWAREFWAAVAVGVAGFVLAFLFIGGLFFDMERDRASEERIAKDRIAACVTSDDVVGCLKEARR